MTATDELRRLLDERGVDWKADDSDVLLHTLWRNEVGQLATYFEPIGDSTDGFMHEVSLYGCTPEQAIAATLGRGECNITRDFKCGACGHQYPKRNCEAYTTEDGRQAWKSLDHWVLACDKPNYCPNCGERVERREE